MKKFARAVVMLTLVAVLAASAFALAACDNKDKGGGVFSEEMGFGDILDIFQNMDSWTETVTGKYNLGGESYEGSITARVDGLDYIATYATADTVNPVTVYSFRYLTYYYEITETNNGTPSYTNLRKYNAGSHLNIPYERISVIIEEENPTAYKYNGEYYPNLGGATGIILMVLQDGADGSIEKTYQKNDDGMTLDAKVYLKDNGLCMDVYMTNQITGESMDLTVKVTDVDETEVVIPEEVQKLKSLC